MSRKLKNENKGITLIALIITIIIMLILVVTAVNVTMNSGLFEKAAKAGDEWEKNEINLVSEGVSYIDEIVAKYTGGTGECTGHEVENWTITKVATCTEVGLEKGNCKKCGAEGTREIPATGHNWENGVCTKCGLENNAPTISAVTLNTKTTNSFTVDVTATDVEETNLTYSLYISGENEPVATSTGSGTVSLEATNLGMYTDYTYYVTVTDNIETSTSGTNSVKTKCSGQTTTCATNECTTGSTVACTKCSGTGTCATCGGDGEVVSVSHTFMAVDSEGDTGMVCDKCLMNTQSMQWLTCKLCSATGRRYTCTYCSRVEEFMNGDFPVTCSTSCSSCELASGICSTCSGNKNIYTYCSHTLAEPHLYCDHYTNTTITSHKICDHSTNGVEHE